MTMGYKEKLLLPNFSYKNYITRRAIKFYPLHWLTLLAALPFAIMTFDKWSLPIFALNATLLHSLIPIKDVYFSFNAVSWYLVNTMFFALVFPFVLKFILNRTTKGCGILLTVLILLYVAITIFLPRDWYHAILYISPFVRFTDFILGIFLALGYMKLKEKTDVVHMNNLLWHILIIFLVILLVVESCILPETTRFISPVYWILVAALILFTSLRNTCGGYNLFENKYLYRLGELSFTIYMTHQLILKYSRKILATLHVENDIFYIAFTLALTIVVSILVDKYIINPITQWLTKKIQPSMTARL